MSNLISDKKSEKAGASLNDLAGPGKENDVRELLYRKTPSGLQVRDLERDPVGRILSHHVAPDHVDHRDDRLLVPDPRLKVGTYSRSQGMTSVLFHRKYSLT